MNMKLAPITAILLSVVLSAPAAAQAEEIASELAADIGRTIAEVEAELAAIDVRQASDDWMVFESQSQGLIEVDLGTLDQWLPGVAAIRAESRSAVDTALAATMPDLWAASVLMAEAPDWVLESGGSTAAAWLRDRFGHLQTPARKAQLYDAERARLLAELEALRRSREFFRSEAFTTESATTETVQAESTEVETFCREIALGETLVAEDGSITYLGAAIPPIDELPDWCRDALLVWLTGSDDPLPTPPAEEVVALEPVHRGEDDVGWEPDPDVRHARWDGVWEYWGAPTLTLQQVGEYVYGVYQDGDGWMKLAVTDDHMLKGRWYEHEHAAACDEARDGTTHWGTVVLSFDDAYDDYWGQFGVCDRIESGISGARAR